MDFALTLPPSATTNLKEPVLALSNTFTLLLFVGGQTGSQQLYLNTQIRLHIGPVNTTVVSPKGIQFNGGGGVVFSMFPFVQTAVHILSQFMIHIPQNIKPLSRFQAIQCLSDWRCLLNMLNMML